MDKLDKKDIDKLRGLEKQYEKATKALGDIIDQCILDVAGDKDFSEDKLDEAIGRFLVANINITNTGELLGK